MTKIASFDIDAQVGFTPLAPNELPVSGGNDIVDELNYQATLCDYRIYSKDWHNRNAIWLASDDNPQFTAIEGDNVDIRWNAHCIGGEYGAQLLPGLPSIMQYDFGVYKGMEPDMHPYGALYHDLGDTKSTGVLEFLKYNSVDIVIVGGLATDFCVATTVRQLVKNNFKVVLNLPACRSIGSDITELIEELTNMGVYCVNNRTELRNTIEYVACEINAEREI